MKILAVVSLKQGVALEQVRPELQAELQGSWRLYVNGVLREAYLTESASTVVFVLEAPDLADAAVELQKLPLVAKGLFDFQLHELRPFANWAMLPLAPGPTGASR